MSCSLSRVHCAPFHAEVRATKIMSCVKTFATITDRRHQNFDRNWYRYFFSDTKFSETETFFPILISETKFSKTNNPQKLSKSLETETETGTFQYLWQFLKRSSPNISSSRKKIFSLSEYFLPFSSPLEFRYQVFQNQNRDFFSRPNFLKPKLFSETKFSETEPGTNFSKTETFFRPNFTKPKLFSESKFSVPKPLKDWQKSRNRSFETKMSISG